MTSPAAFVSHLEALGVRSFFGVPDSLLKAFGQCVMGSVPTERHVITANEGAAVGMAMGHHMATGEIGLVYLQNSGLGNTVNPLMSLADPEVYGVPMLLLIGWRGEPGVRDEPQHVKQGRVMKAMLDAMEIPHLVLEGETEADAAIATRAIEIARGNSTPVVLVARDSTFEPEVQPVTYGLPGLASLPTREAALAATIGMIDDAAIVATTGMLSRELFELRAATGAGGDQDFLTVGGMGHAVAIALGVAQASSRETWCLDGDGAMLMHMGSLATVGHVAGSNFFHAVFNNGVHDSVGGQPTSIVAVDVPAIARAAGYRSATRVERLTEIPAAIASMRLAGGPALLEIRVRPGARGDLGRPTRTPRESLDAFRAAMSAAT